MQSLGAQRSWSFHSLVFFLLFLPFVLCIVLSSFPHTHYLFTLRFPLCTLPLSLFFFLGLCIILFSLPSTCFFFSILFDSSHSSSLLPVAVYAPHPARTTHTPTRTRRVASLYHPWRSLARHAPHPGSKPCRQDRYASGGVRFVGCVVCVCAWVCLCVCVCVVVSCVRVLQSLPFGSTVYLPAALIGGSGTPRGGGQG